MACYQPSRLYFFSAWRRHPNSPPVPLTVPNAGLILIVAHNVPYPGFIVAQARNLVQQAVCCQSTVPGAELYYLFMSQHMGCLCTCSRLF